MAQTRPEPKPLGPESYKKTTTLVSRKTEPKSETYRSAGQILSSKQYKETLKLTIVPPVDSSQIKRLEQELNQIEDLQIKFIGNTQKGGVEIIVSARKYPPLVSIMRQLTIVKRAVSKNDEILMRLRSYF